MELKNSIKKYRQVKGFTQEELALKSCVSRQTIISIERYRYKPSLELGLKIALLSPIFGIFTFVISKIGVVTLKLLQKN